ncbi:hypothetical protein Tco_0198313 [Tanacetum coccineum]
MNNQPLSMAGKGGDIHLLVRGVSISIFACSCNKTVSNKACGRIWLCHLPESGRINLRIREDRPVIRTSQSRQHDKSESVSYYLTD